MTVANNVTRLRAEIDTATLIAVSKTRSVDEIRQALIAGQRVFGENRVQEAQAKFPQLRVEYPDIELHLIGPLQTNKADEAVHLFDVIQTLDRPKLAEKLAAAISKVGRTPRLYVEINIGKEPQKTGIAPDELGEFLTFCCDRCGLQISGLMCIPPQSQDPTMFFRRMKQLADKHHLPHLSLGMSADYQEALKCGATEVRIGTAIFGTRLQNHT